MSGEKLSARQKMIGMMYLVLTAMLAMNISKEVLNAFVKVNNGLQTSNRQMAGEGASVWSSFNTKLSTNRQKVQPFFDAAKEVNDKSDAMAKYLVEVQAYCLAASEKKLADDWRSIYIGQNEAQRDTVTNIALIKKKDEYQELTARMVGSNPDKPKEVERNKQTNEKIDPDDFSANDVKLQLEDYKEFLKNISVTSFDGKPYTPNKGLIDGLEETFKYEGGIENGVGKTWEALNFMDVPLAAVITNLSKMSLDVENARANILKDLIAGVEGKDYKFTNLIPIVIPESNYILRGDSFRADIILAAYDASNSPAIYIDKEWDQQDSSMFANGADDEALEVGLDGRGKLRIGSSGKSLGDHSFRGVIKYQGPTGEIEDHPFVLPTPFTIAEPALVVSPTKMNVFYRGLPNPVEISVPGVDSEKLSVSCSGGHSLKKEGKDGWIMRPGKSKDAIISVTADMPDGSRKKIGEKPFRVKRIPDPVPKFAGKRPNDSSVNANAMKIATGVRAEMENFDFDVKVSVKSFNMVFIRGGQVIEKSSSSNKTTSEMKANMAKVKRGQKVYIEKIMVTMPDGTTRQLANLALKVT
jgi:gliding motility-associated protein GldM